MREDPRLATWLALLDDHPITEVLESHMQTRRRIDDADALVSLDR